MNSALIDLNISVKPNSKLDFDKFSLFIADFVFHLTSPMQEHFLQEWDDIHELWRLLRGDILGFVNKHSLQVVIAAIVGINAKWMYANEIVGPSLSVAKQDGSQIGIFAQDLFFLTNEQERLKLMKLYHDWYLHYSLKL